MRARWSTCSLAPALSPCPSPRPPQSTLSKAMKPRSHHWIAGSVEPAAIARRAFARTAIAQRDLIQALHLLRLVHVQRHHAALRLRCCIGQGDTEARSTPRLAPAHEMRAFRRSAHAHFPRNQLVKLRGPRNVPRRQRDITGGEFPRPIDRTTRKPGVICHDLLLSNHPDSRSGTKVEHQIRGRKSLLRSDARPKTLPRQLNRSGAAPGLA